MAFTNYKTWSAGETLTAANFNQQIRDNGLSMGPHLIVRKTADETDSTNVLQNDDVLLLALLANEVWQFKFNLLVSAATTTDFNVRLTFPSGSISAVLYASNGSTFDGFDFSSASSPTAQTTIDTAGATISNQVIIEGTMSNGGSAGNFQLQWTGAAAAACVVKANSTLWAVKLA